MVALAKPPLNTEDPVLVPDAVTVIQPLSPGKLAAEETLKEEVERLKLENRKLQADLGAAGLVLVDSYVSMTEVSEYSKGMPEEMLKPRLYPLMPPVGMRAMCFYPMSKRRGLGPDDANWFTTPFEDRMRLMHEHGTSGRKFAGRIVQLITGSAGLDNYEWGVTLFATDPADLKEVVYTMRFDEASARFAEFGPFVTGLVDSIELVLGEVAP